MMRTIFFDFDGVLTLNERGSTTTIEVIHELNPDLPVQLIQSCYYRFHHDLLLGKVTHLGIWPDFCRCMGRDLDRAILHEAFSRTPLNQEMLRLASELAARYDVGIITDNASDRMAHLVAEHRLDALFAPIVVSAHVGKLKDAPALFEHALCMAGHRAEECGFIDNQPGNLVVPARLGFETYLYETQCHDIPRLTRQLADWGIEV
jgi:putative hydrolase of the HAD superfamily